MRPKQQKPIAQDDLFRSRLAQIINMRHELVRLADEIDWQWIDAQVSGSFSDKGCPAVPSRFMVGLLFLKHIYALSDEGVCERWVHDPYFQFFTGETFFQHDLPHERSGLSHWRKRIGGTLDKLLAETLIGKGKARTPYEFGCKVSTTTTNHRCAGGQIKRELRRRSAVEAVIGHLKSDGHLGRNFLKGREGDHTNAVLTAVGYNFRLILKWIRLLCAKIILMISALIEPKIKTNPGY